MHITLAFITVLICAFVVIFLFNLDTPSAEAQSWRFFVVAYENQTYDVVYLSHDTVKNITASAQTIDIILQSEHDGEVQVAIPKELLNATGILYDEDGIVPGVFVDKQISEDYARLK